jgi:membrane associated rhomboid family serine protease
MNIVDEIKESFRKGTLLIKLIYVNIGVFLLVNIVRLFYFLIYSQSDIPQIEWLAVPSDVSNLIYKPWTIVTYMFLHVEFFHILFNMLWLYWFAIIFLQYFNEKKLFGVYILGGFSGALLYILAFNTLPVFQMAVSHSVALGASASVIAIVVAISFYVPNYTLNLMFIGPVKIKYIALFSIVLDIISIPAENAGGHIAHLGGAVFGYFFALEASRGKDLTKGFNQLIDQLVNLFKPKQKMKVSYKKPGTQKPKSDLEYNKTKQDQQAEIDKILDKISKHGYGSLSKQEKDILFNASDKNKK